MKTSDQINEIASALAKANSEIKGADKDSENPFFKSKYADLSAVLEAARGPLSKNGLSILQPLYSKEVEISFLDTEKQVKTMKGLKHFIKTLLIHSSGQYIESDEVEVINKDASDIQKFGSAVTYTRRYSLKSFLGIPDQDDDGNQAAQQQSKSPIKNYAPQGKP